MENMLMTLGLGSLSYLGILAFLTMILVEDLKQIVSKSFPTQLLTIIVSLVLSILLPIFCGTLTFASLGTSILNGFIAAFISMNGFDSLKNIWEKLNNRDLSDDNE